MNAPALTYRDRALAAEARVAELEAEVAAWRDYRAVGPRATADEAEILMLGKLQRRLRALTGMHDSRGAARTLLVLLAHAGKLCRKQTIFDAIAVDADTQIKVVDVRVSRVRTALRIIGYPEAITTVWGEGYVLAAEAAEPIRRTLGLAAEDRAA